MTKATALFLMLGLVVSCRSGETDAAPAEAETPKPDVAKPATSPEGLDRTVLPIPQPTYPAATELDARNAKAPPPFEIKAPEGAPNVVIVLIDDIGFGTASSFGGPIATPTLDSLAEGGLRYNQFHTTALCSPTRMALLTGRNHHSANTGSVQEVATGFPGNNGMRPGTVAPLAEMLRLNGYSTAAFGQVSRDASVGGECVGPVRSLALRTPGFDKFYGFIGGEANQWAPLIYDGHHQDRARTTPTTTSPRTWPTRRSTGSGSSNRSRPTSRSSHTFATGRDACASPRPQRMDREVPRASFDAGWDKYREETLARQIELGVVPGNQACAQASRHSRLGQLCRKTRSGSSRIRWRCSRRLPSTPTTRSAGSFQAIEDLGEGGTTPSSSTFSETTARVPKAGWPGRSTRWSC